MNGSIENKGLKRILSKNPTFQDFRNCTLVYDEAQALDKKVRKLTGIRENIATEPGLPSFTGTIFEMRQFFRSYIGDPTEKGEFTNPEGRKLNPALLEWENISADRRKQYFQEIKASNKFTKIYHGNRKFNVLEEGETYKEMLQLVKSVIAEEDDFSIKNDLLTKLNFIISSSKSEKKRQEKLKEFYGELMDSLSKETDNLTE